jgi:hypothetical protein
MGSLKAASVLCVFRTLSLLLTGDVIEKDVVHMLMPPTFEVKSY